MLTAVRCVPPPYQGWKEAVVTYTCDGKTYTNHWPETAQISLPAEGPPGIIPSCPAPAVATAVPSTSGGTKTPPPQRPDFPVNNSAWRVNNDPNLWIFLPDGTCHAQSGYWKGTWQRRDGGIWMDFEIPSARVHDAFLVRASADGQTLQAIKNGQVIGTGQRVR
jgi:hypothetical protein